MRRWSSYTEASAALAGLVMLVATCGAATAPELPDAGWFELRELYAR